MGSISHCNDHVCDGDGHNYPSNTTNLLEKTSIEKLKIDFRIEDPDEESEFERGDGQFIGSYSDRAGIHEEFKDLQVDVGPFSDGDRSHQNKPLKIIMIRKSGVALRKKSVKVPKTTRKS